MFTMLSYSCCLSMVYKHSSNVLKSSVALVNSRNSSSGSGNLLNSSYTFIESVKKSLVPRPGPPSNRFPLYRSSIIYPLRMLQRFKIAHVGVVGALSSILFPEVNFDAMTLQSIGIATGSVGSATAFLFFFNKFIESHVCEISIKDDMKTLLLSTLDFWGRRRDIIVPVKSLLPPHIGLPRKRVDKLNAKLFQRLELASYNKQFLLSLRMGKIHFPDMLFDLLSGKPLKPPTMTPTPVNPSK